MWTKEKIQNYIKSAEKIKIKIKAKHPKFTKILIYLDAQISILKDVLEK